MNNWLNYGLCASFIWAVAGLSYLLFKTLSYPKQRFYSLAEGEPKKGILYALGPGLLPWTKEASFSYLSVYLLGASYHLSIFTGFLLLILTLTGIKPGAFGRNLIAGLLGIGALSGLGLLIRRMVKTEVRWLSSIDDFTANLLVDAFIVSGLLSLFYPSFNTSFLVISILLFVYIPLGKIRHCWFFFITRVFFGRFFGHRGVFPRSYYEILEKQKLM